MTSRSLLDSKYFDNLLINNLYVQNNLKVLGNFRPPESFLFSIHFNDPSNSSPFTILDNSISLKTNLLDSPNANIVKLYNNGTSKNINSAYLIEHISSSPTDTNVHMVSPNSDAFFTIKHDVTSSCFILIPKHPNTKLDGFNNNSSFSMTNALGLYGWSTSGVVADVPAVPVLVAQYTDFM